MTLRCLFVDFNSFFASVEQQDQPELRCRPVGVVPVMAATTCCIAASVEAKQYGIGTGTPVWEALQTFPGIALVQARPARYIEVHHRLMAAIADCIPHDTPASIDEVPCWLLGRERQRENAEAIAGRIKQRITAEFDWIRCSIGIAPNRFLAKTASDMRKPDGLTVIEQADLPHALHELELRDLCGIGPSMERRLRAAGIQTVAQLCASPRERLRTAWGSVEGERFWLQLRGQELPARATTRSSVGHSHVLGPQLRTLAGARSVLFKLLGKAAMRLRKDGYAATGMAIRLRFVGQDRRFERDLSFAPLQDTPTFLHLLAGALAALEHAAAQGRWQPQRHPPLSVAVTLTGLERTGDTTGELLAQRGRARMTSAVVDRINRRFGHNAIYFGAMKQAIDHDAAPMRIPFSHIPDTASEQDQGHAQAGDLLALRERQAKVLAEAAHRQAQAQRARPPGAAAPAKAGAGGWSRRSEAAEAPAGPGTTLPLF